MGVSMRVLAARVFVVAVGVFVRMIVALRSWLMCMRRLVGVLMRMRMAALVQMLRLRLARVRRRRRGPLRESATSGKAWATPGVARAGFCEALSGHPQHDRFVVGCKSADVSSPRPAYPLDSL